MFAKTILIKVMGWKSFCMNLPLCFLLGIAPLFAGGYNAKDVCRQQKNQCQHEGTPKQQPPNFSKQELKKFALVKSKVDEIRKKFSRALGKVDKPDKALKLQDKYLNQIVDSIRKKGLSVDRYNEISRAVQRSKELQEKIAEMLDKESSN